MKTRKSNIELCRIICLMLIIGHHCVGHGGSLNMDSCINKWIAYVILPGGKICFDTFIAISCWFLVDQTFRAERFIKMWLEVLFYSVLTISIAALLGSQFTVLDWITAFLPITGSVQGYAQTYLAFYLLLPFLTKVSQNMTKRQNKYIIGLLTMFCIVYRIVSYFEWSEQSVYCRLILFVYIYFIILHIKKNHLFENKLLTGIMTITLWGGNIGILHWKRFVSKSESLELLGDSSV